MPEVTFSAAMVTISMGTLCPARAWSTNTRVPAICSTPQISRVRMIPSRLTMTPPIRPPAMVAPRPNTLLTLAISTVVNPIST